MLVFEISSFYELFFCFQCHLFPQLYFRPFLLCLFLFFRFSKIDPQDDPWKLDRLFPHVSTFSFFAFSLERR